MFALDYVGSVTLEEPPDGGSPAHWAIRFQPKVPGTGWLVTALSKRTLKQVLDLVECTAVRRLADRYQ